MLGWPRKRSHRRARSTYGLRTPLVIYLGLAVSLGAALAQDESILGAQTSGLNVNKPVHFQVWRTITLGAYKGVDAYRDALDSARIKIGDSADQILGRPAFPYATTKTDVELVLLSAANLGVESESSLADVYKRARQAGLELCPAEVGPQLRLDYRNQPLGEALDVAIEPVAHVQRGPHDLDAGELGHWSRTHRSRWAVRVHGVPDISLRVRSACQWTSGGNER